jgi:hypothetical protein
VFAVRWTGEEELLASCNQKNLRPVSQGFAAKNSVQGDERGGSPHVKMPGCKIATELVKEGNLVGKCLEPVLLDQAFWSVLRELEEIVILLQALGIYACQVVHVFKGAAVPTILGMKSRDVVGQGVVINPLHHGCATSLQTRCNKSGSAYCKYHDEGHLTNKSTFGACRKYMYLIVLGTQPGRSMRQCDAFLLAAGSSCSTEHCAHDRQKMEIVVNRRTAAIKLR